MGSDDPLADILAAKMGGKWSIDRNLAARWGSDDPLMGSFFVWQGLCK
jgi:hypothetical protein